VHTAETVHPHGRGDNGVPTRCDARCSRFTPTGVGTIISSARNTAARAVHPHGRGDNSETPSLHAMSVGSPPRAWGQCRKNDFFQLS